MRTVTSKADLDRTRLQVVLCILATFLLGTPIWWKTTEVHRAPLPVKKIKAWVLPEALRLAFNINIALKFQEHPYASDSSKRRNVEAIAKDVTEQLDKLYSVFQPNGARDVANEGAQVANETDADAGGEGPAAKPEVSITFSVKPQVDASPASAGEGYIVIVSCVSETESQETSQISIEADRTARITLDQCTDDALTTSTLVATIGGLFADEQMTYKQMSSPTSRSSTFHAEWDNMRTMKYAAQYQVTFSLLVANPSDFLVSWDIQDAVNAYIDPLFDALSDISDFDVHSQIQNYATLPVTPEIVEKDGRKLHILKPSVLPRFINSAEWTLASVVSTAPPLNHILYIPSLEQSPLQLVKDNGEPLSTNAFLMPRWGGVVIQNPEVRGKGSRIHLNATSLHPFMEVAVAHLRDLLGVKKVRIPNADSVLPEISSIVYASAPLTGLTQWEHGRLVRWRTVQNMVDAIDTLNSLSNLIERLESMVVLDDIQSQVVQALQSLREAHKTLSQSHTPSEYTLALQHSKKATVLASKAFFDPTMLAMLYFPDEHKYAVYMPLFVPISVPVLVAAMKELKRALKRRKAKRAGRAGKETGGGNSPAIGLDGPDMDADEEDGAEKENKEE